MTRQSRRSAFDARHLSAAPGDVFHWYCEQIPKFKFHICISYDFDFLFLNTPKDVRHPSDFAIRSQQIRFLKPTPENFSAVSCVDVQTVGSVDAFVGKVPDFRGNVASDVVIDLLDHVCGLRRIEKKLVARLADVRRTFRLSLGD